MAKNESHDTADAAHDSHAGAVSRIRARAARIWLRIWKERGLILGAIAIIVSYLAMQAANRSADSSAESANASKQMVEEHTSPVLNARAKFIRIPVPDFYGFTKRDRHTDSVVVPLYSQFVQSKGAWEVTVENDGDAVADDVRIRAPGIFFARHVSFSTGVEVNWDLVRNSQFTVGDLAPQQRFSGIFWLRPGYTPSDNCDTPVASALCFTLDQLIVFGSNTTAHVVRERVRPPGFGDTVSDTEPR